jgi:hypothetical protein
MENKTESKKPIQKFKSGAVEACIWDNTKTINGNQIASYGVTIDRKYKDKNGDWQNTSSLTVNDLPKAVVVLEDCYRFLTTKKHEESSDS